MRGAKNKKPTWTRISGTWALGFRCLDRLDPQQPQARNVRLPTATAAATTHGLASHSHTWTRLRGAVRCVNAVCNGKKLMLANGLLGAGRHSQVIPGGRGLAPLFWHLALCGINRGTSTRARSRTRAAAVAGIYRWSGRTLRGGRTEG